VVAVLCSKKKDVAFPMKDSSTKPSVSARELAEWIKPAVGMMKLKCDGVVACDGRQGSVAMVCRSEDGNYPGAPARIIEELTLEAEAHVEALSLASDLQLQHIHIVTDCLEVINNPHMDIGLDMAHLVSRT
jgi:hypothetical protein